MTPDNILNELNDFVALLLESTIAISANRAILNYRRRGIINITWATNNSVPGYLFRQNVATISEYREWVNSQGYLAVLYDGSLIQMSYQFAFHELIGHRLLYFPCPFDFEQDLLINFPLVDVIDLLEEEGCSGVRLRTPIRFDYDPTSSADNHSASHMTFQWAHCRIPVKSPISPGHFIRFIFRNFYPDLWNVHEFLREWPCHEFVPTISQVEKPELHFSYIT